MSQEPDMPTEVNESQLHCVGCGYNLTGVTIGSFCPECGQAVEDTLAATRSPKTSGHAVTCLVLGILSLTVCGLIGPLAIAFYFSARKDYTRGICSPGSRGMAIAGLVLGIIGSLGGLLMAVLITAGEIW